MIHSAQMLDAMCLRYFTDNTFNILCVHVQLVLYTECNPNSILVNVFWANRLIAARDA